MTYKLEYLDQLVKMAAPAVVTGVFVLTESDRTNILREAMEEADKIKAALVQEVFAFSKEKEIEVFIKNYQLGCTHLLDRIYAQGQLLDAGRDAASDFYRKLCLPILSVLSFIEERFSKYFERSEKVPDIYLQLTREELRAQHTLLAVQQMAAPDAVTLDGVTTRLQVFINGTADKPVTYRDIMFYKELSKELNDLPQWQEQANIFSGLQQLLVYLNYNAREFINGMVNRISAELGTMDDLNDRIDRLLQYAKALNQLLLKPESGLLPRHPSVKQQLATWFAEELSYLEHKLAGVQTHAAAAAAPVGKSKIICRLPVDQLGIFFRAASDLQLVTTGSQKALFEQLAPFLSTTHRSILSPDSMRSKSYSPEKKDIEAVKDILMQLFRQVGKY